MVVGSHVSGRSSLSLSLSLSPGDTLIIINSLGVVSYLPGSIYMPSQVESRTSLFHAKENVGAKQK